MQPNSIERYLETEFDLIPGSVSVILQVANEFARLQTNIDRLKAINESMADRITIAEAHSENLEVRTEALKKQLCYSYSEKDALMARLNKANTLADQQEQKIDKLHKLVDSYIVEHYPVPKEDDCPK